MSVIGDILKRGDIVVIDTCSLMMEKPAIMFTASLKPLLKKYNQKLIVPRVVLCELKKHLESGDQALVKKAQTATNLVADLKNEDLLLVLGDESDGTFADNVFLSRLGFVVVEQAVSIITQDNNLTADLLNLNHRKSVSRSQDLRVYKILSNGTLEEVRRQWS